MIILDKKCDDIAKQVNPPIDTAMRTQNRARKTPPSYHWSRRVSRHVIMNVSTHSASVYLCTCSLNRPVGHHIKCRHASSATRVRLGDLYNLSVGGSCAFAGIISKSETGTSVFELEALLQSLA